MIRFTMYYSGNRTISAITHLRAATGCGLREAKDCVEHYGRNPIIMAKPQFAVFMVGVHNDTAGCASEWNIRDVEEVNRIVDTFDFSKIIPTT